MVQNAQVQTDLLSILGMPSGDQQMLAPKGEPGFAALFAQLLGPSDPTEGANLLGGKALDPGALQRSSRFDLGALLDGQQSDQAVDLVSSAAPLAQLLGGAQGMAKGEQLLHLLQVPPGQYAISSSEVVDGDWIVEASPRDGNMPSIRIAIPTELLRNGFDLSQLNLGDGTKESLTQLRGEFSKLLNDVRATDLEIRLTPSKTETGDQMLSYRIAGKHPSGDVVFAGSQKVAPQTQSHQRGVEPMTGVVSDHDGDGGGKSQARGEMQQQGNGMAGNGQSNPMEELAMLSRTKSTDDGSTKKFDFVQLQSQSGRADASLGSVSSTTPTETTSAPEELLHPRDVRFTLPEMLHAKLRPNGPSVTLRIQPANLGPARLSLVMHKDHLSARVIVDSAAAKHAVEGSMDKLLDQLQRADVKVDSIQVMTSQQHPGNDSFGRQSQWAHQQKNSHQPAMPFDGAGDAAVESATSTISRGSLGYLGSGGVNMLA